MLQPCLLFQTKVTADRCIAFFNPLVHMLACTHSAWAKGIFQLWPYSVLGMVSCGEPRRLYSQKVLFARHFLDAQYGTCHSSTANILLDNCQRQFVMNHVIHTKFGTGIRLTLLPTYKLRFWPLHVACGEEFAYGLAKELIII